MGRETIYDLPNTSTNSNNNDDDDISSSSHATAIDRTHGNSFGYRNYSIAELAKKYGGLQGPEGWMASNETGSSCFTECLGSILYQMCRKSPYSKAVKLINTSCSNENVAQTFTYQVVSILKGTLIPYSLRRFLWPLALFKVATLSRTELDNPIIWDGHKMRELESSARKHFGVLLASGTERLGLVTPLCSKFDGIISKDMKEKG